jgi:hypothetical protein
VVDGLDGLSSDLDMLKHLSESQLFSGVFSFIPEGDEDEDEDGDGDEDGDEACKVSMSAHGTDG